MDQKNSSSRPVQGQSFNNPPMSGTMGFPAGPTTPTVPSSLITQPGGFPTGKPTGPAFPSPAFTSTGMPISSEIPAQTLANPQFLAGYLKTQIGRRVRIEFLIGTNLLTDRSGLLVAVGASYVIIRLQETDDLMVCDLYSIRFVTIFR
jgi:hypothetical protein